MPENEILNKVVVLAGTYGMKLLGAIVVLLIGFWVAKMISRGVEKLVLRGTDTDASVGVIIRRSIFITLMTVVAIAVLDRFGVETTSFIAVLGAAGLAIGLALQGTLSNIAAGVMILVLRPFRTGDAIQIGGGEVYIVDEIGLFVTRAHKPDCPNVTIPNAKIWGDTIVNFSNTWEDNRRFDIIFGVSYSDNLNESIEVLKKLANDDARVLSDPEPFIKIESLGDSSVNILFRVHTKATDWWEAKLDLTKAGKDALEASGISIPFPQRDVHIFNS